MLHSTFTGTYQGESCAMTTELPEHVARNRRVWDQHAVSYATNAPRAWAQEVFTWGGFKVPDTEIGALPPDLAGMDVIELGCGTAYVSAWLARMGAHPVGLDNSPNQLETARQMQAQFGLEFPLLLGNAEQLPFDDGSFDLAISEYGASIWCDPYLWIPEAARVLRPGGWLVFLCNGVLVPLCTAPDDLEGTPLHTSLKRPLFGMHRFEWVDDESVEFHLAHGEMFRVLRGAGFSVENLIEIEDRVGSGMTSPVALPEWTTRWPAEEIWVARKR